MVDGSRAGWYLCNDVWAWLLTGARLLASLKTDARMLAKQLTIDI